MTEQRGRAEDLLAQAGITPPPSNTGTVLPSAELPPVDQLLGELADLAKDKRRRRIHEVIRAVAGAPVEAQQDYREAIVGARHMPPGDWREALAEAKRAIKREAAGQAPAASGGQEHGPPPPGALDITDEPDAVRGISEAIGEGAFPDVYLRGHQLVQVATGDDWVETRDVDEKLLRRLITDHLRCAKLTRIGWRGALPHPMTCAVVLAVADWPTVPKLRGVASYPVLLTDGAILQEPGYHHASGLYLHHSVAVGTVPDRPGPADVDAARGFLLGKYLRDFPWVCDADRANYLAMLLTPLLREVIGHLFPFFYITAPERGSGKSLLALLPQILYGGAPRALPEKETDIHKGITSALRGSDPLIMYDNVPSGTTIKSPALAAVLTAPYWTDRILGGSRDGKWPNDRLWAATGTNIELGGDFAQRSVRIAIDFGKPNPDLRSGFAIPDIDIWTRAHRGEVLRHLLVLARAWQVSGAPEDSHVMRGYTRWARVVGGLLAYHEIPGFLGNRDEIRAHDEDGAEWERFLRMWHSRYGSAPRLIRDVLTDATAQRELADALPSTLDGGPHTARSLGKAMKAHEGRWYGGLSPRCRHDKHTGTMWWRVEDGE